MNRWKRGLKVNRKVFDIHNHIGEMESWKYYGMEHPVNPTVFSDNDRRAKVAMMDQLGVERSIVLSNYGVPVPNQPFTLNPVVLDACANPDARILGGIWFSPMLKMKAENEAAMKLAGEKGIRVLKASCLLGGTWDPTAWDPETKVMWESIIDTCERHGHVFHLHTSPGGGSDVSNAIKFVRTYGKRVKVHVVHCGGGASGHIKFIPEFLKMIREGYQVYTDATWSIGFAGRFLLSEIEKNGIGADRVLFASDEPWSDFWGEYWKIEGAECSEELKNNIFWNNAEKLYGG
jgi:predicted TIM-barrel fold metal-dependent hydrolase